MHLFTKILNMKIPRYIRIYEHAKIFGPFCQFKRCFVVTAYKVIKIQKLEIPLINNRNKSGHMTDSCGTPDEIFTNDDNFPFQSTACWRWCKYDFNHSRFADLHDKGFPLSHTALTLSGTHLKKILKSFAVIVLGIDLLLIFGMTLVSSDPNLRGYYLYLENTSFYFV